MNTNTKNKKRRKRAPRAAFLTALLAALLLFAGCEDLFHPEKPGGNEDEEEEQEQSTTGITNITYSPVSGGTWTLQSDGRYKSPAISNSSITKMRVGFTSNSANTSITVQLDVSSEADCDFAFISEPDNADATSVSGYYSGSRISGTNSVTVTILVPTAGSHFIDIGYSKDGTRGLGSDCAWFKVTDPSSGGTPGGGTSDGGTPVPSNLSFNDALTWISDNAVEGGTYIITLGADATIGPKTLSYSDKTVGVTITGGSTARLIMLSANGSLFTVESGVTLTLGANVTLQGRSGNTASLVTVNSGGTLVMNAGSKMSDNSWSGYGGGVNVYTGTFTMNGGEISGNTSSSSGGGVHVGGTFTMNGGEISGNTSSSGGGVCANSTFTMSGGTINGNTASGSGGGVYVGNTFTMSGGTISGNTAPSGYGGGVYVYNDGTFTKLSSGTGIIYGSDNTLKNTAKTGADYGQAVYVSGSPAKKRNTTAGSGVMLNSGVSGAPGGWE
jgi:hypothetical protein